MFSYIKNYLLDIFFPIECLFCQKPDIWICKKCLNNIEIIETQFCPYCEKTISPSGYICTSCKTKFRAKNDKNYLDALVVSSSYKKNNISHIIHIFKYNFVFDLSAPLSKIMIQSIIKNNLPLPDLIFPVPLHPRRLRWRGFNQAELLSKEISKNLTPGFTIPMIPDLLIRKKFTPPQMKIKKYQKRKSNLKDAFSINPKIQIEQIKNKNVLLVDDVSTTGSTIFECAKILKENGANKVFAVVIARQKID